MILIQWLYWYCRSTMVVFVCVVPTLCYLFGSAVSLPKKNVNPPNVRLCCMRNKAKFCQKLLTSLDSSVQYKKYAQVRNFMNVTSGDTNARFVEYRTRVTPTLLMFDCGVSVGESFPIRSHTLCPNTNFSTDSLRPSASLYRSYLSSIQRIIKGTVAAYRYS
jgi:hypothetical protein